jgi:DNA invertase Pin-like site-specific DNA recombinase
MSDFSTRIALYARYSSDLQATTSIEDQIRACREFIAATFAERSVEIIVFEDAAISGSTLNRPGIQQLIHYVRGGQIDVVVAEGIDRLSRSMADMANFFDLLVNTNVPIYTMHEGLVSDLHIGMKGTMNRVHLKDLKDRIRRGQAGRTQEGFVMGAAAYGYRVIRGVVDARGRTVNGLKEVVPEEAEIVNRIFEEYAARKPSTAIVRDLTIEQVSGRTWYLKTVRAMLCNPIYKGDVVYGRSKKMRDPVTGKISYKSRPKSDWLTVHREELRIISDDLWRRVEARRKRLPETKALFTRKDFSVHQRVLTDYIYCGACGAVKHVANDSRYVCSENRYQHTCKNSRGTKEAEIRRTFFEALITAATNLPQLRPTILNAYEADIRRRHDLDRRETEAQGKIDRLMQAIEDGIDYRQAVERIKVLQTEKARLKQAIAFEVVPTIGTEEEIRARISQAIGLLRTEAEREPVRDMLAVIKPRITLTPIPDSYRGETITIELPDSPEPWARFWMLLQER